MTQNIYPSQPATKPMRTDDGHGLSVVDWIAVALVVVGAVNWALVGLFKFNLVAAIFGQGSTLSRIVYVIVGVAGLYVLYLATQVRHVRRVATA
jgi:uncharacterized membrane protein YuzA (DUF378 family)